MKVIRSMWEDVCRVNCSCCQDNDYLTIQRNKNFIDDEDKIAYFYKFVYKEDMPITYRFRTAVDMIKHCDSYKNGEKQLDSGFPIDFDQLWELYTLITEDSLTNGIIEKSDIDYIENFKNPKVIKFLTCATDKNWYSEMLFKSKDGLILSADFYKNEKKKIIHVADFNLGWSIPVDIKDKEIRKRALEYLFNKKRKYFVLEYDGFLYKDDVVQFLAVVNNYLQRIDQLKNDTLVLKPEK